LRFISAAEHDSDQILARSSSYFSLIMLVIFGPTSLTFGYFVYLNIESEHFLWRNDSSRGHTTFYEYYMQSDMLWFAMIMATVCLIGFVIFLVCLWRTGTVWTVSTPLNGTIEIRKSNWFFTRVIYVPQDGATIRVGRYINPLYKTRTIGWVDVLLIVGEHAFLVEFALIPQDAEALASRLAKKLNRTNEQIDSQSTLHLLPFFIFN